MKTPRGATALGTFFMLLGLMVILYFVWLYTGGPNRPLAHSGPFITQPPFPKLDIMADGSSSTPSTSSSSTYSAPWPGPSTASKTNSLWSYFYTTRDATTNTPKDPSPYTNLITMTVGNAKTNTAQNEYVVIKTSKKNTTNVTATGWTLESGTSGIRAPIGEASAIPFLGDVNVEQPIVLAPDSTMYVVTGRSPKGVSFRTSKCTGYFDQFQTYNPSLRHECPTPQDEMARYPEKVAGNDTCINYVSNIHTCEYRSTSLPGNIGNSCQDFILNTLNYSGCIKDHKSDPDFYKNEWRVYLKRDQELYANTHERIRLLDENKKVIAELSY